MKKKEILSHVDHTLLKQTATWQEIRQVCQEAIDAQTASVCIPPMYVKQAAEYVKGKIPICTVIGFPNGYHTTQVKVFEAQEAVKNGASEIDMVISLGWVKDGLYDEIEREINAVKKACDGRILKVIVETCFLTKEEKEKICEVVEHSHGDFIKTSTGFGSGGATPEDVSLFAQRIQGNTKIKAAGGIRSVDDAQLYLKLGCERLGSSALIHACEEK